MQNRLENEANHPAGKISLAGHLLVASPNVNGGDFVRTVCLIVHHDDNGAVGVVLNRGFDHDVDGLWQHLSNGKMDLRQGLLHFGGPDSGPVIALHNSNKHAEYQTAEGVFLAAQIQNLRELVATTAAEKAEQGSCAVKIIVGQAEWEAGELDQEFMDGHWLPLPVSSDLVFADQQLMWPIAIRAIGNQFVADMTGARLPTDPNCN